VVRVAV